MLGPYAKRLFPQKEKGISTGAGDHYSEQIRTRNAHVYQNSSRQAGYRWTTTPRVELNAENISRSMRSRK